jgi:protein-disulfide isomerase
MNLLTRIGAGIAALGLVAFGITLLTQSADARRDTITRGEVRDIVRDYILENPEIIGEALAILDEREQASQRQMVENDPADFSIGPKDAPIVIVEFFDYRCGYCKQSLDWVMSQVSSGDVRVVFKEYPILSEGSLRGAQAALAAGKQGKYLEMHQALMRSKGDITVETIETLGKSLGLNTKKLLADMDDPSVIEHIRGIHAQADTLGVSGTPGFLVNGTIVGGLNEPRLNELVAAARG